MRVLALFGMALLLSNAWCINDCAFRSCSDSVHHNPAASQPPCHHKAPPSNHRDTDSRCSHQILPGSAVGSLVHAVLQTIAVESVAFANTPTAPPPLIGLAAEFHSPPPRPEIDRTAVLRI